MNPYEIWLVTSPNDSDYERIAEDASDWVAAQELALDDDDDCLGLADACREFLGGK